MRYDQSIRSVVFFSKAIFFHESAVPVVRVFLAIVAAISMSGLGIVSSSGWAATPQNREQVRDRAAKANETSDTDTVPIETPAAGVRLYGTPDQFATWTHGDLSPDGQWLVGFQGMRIMVWDRQAARVAREFDVTTQGNIQGTRFSASGDYFAIFVQHWKDLPDVSDQWESAPETDDFVDLLLAMAPKFRNQLLIYDRQWELIGEYDLATSQLQPHVGLWFSPDESAILINGTSDTWSPMIEVVDLQEKEVFTPERQTGAAFFLNSREVAWPRARQVWNWRRDRMTSLTDTIFSDAFFVSPISEDSDWVLVRRLQVGYSIIQLSTNREIKLSNFSGYAFGYVSPDHRYFLGIGVGNNSRQVVLLDIEQEKELARVDDSMVYAAKFVRNEPQVHLTMTSFGAVRARSVTIRSIPLGEEFAAALRHVSDAASKKRAQALPYAAPSTGRESCPMAGGRRFRCTVVTLSHALIGFPGWDAVAGGPFRNQNVG